MSLRIAITGPESTGKSTLGQELASYYQGVYIPEYARKYLENKGTHYTQQDVLNIGLKQHAYNHSGDTFQTIFCDTEMLVIHIWMTVKYGSTHHMIMDRLMTQQFDHYFLCQPDIPWVADPLRENPDTREELFQMFKNEMTRLSLPFTIISGNWHERLMTCRSQIDQLTSSSCQSSKNS